MPDPGQGAPNGQLTKAQRFEDEKRRIITSCFSKVDTDGSLLESYITHCKVAEDAGETSPDQRKSRVILVAVRKSGRVRVHKARENQNGTYSIGKTWNMDDLSQIENDTSAGGKGFIVTINKPYHWHANSIKEKEFFIQSMLKIYKKYTGGKVPVLVGFEGTEIGRLADQGSSVTSASSSVRSAPKDAPQQRLQQDESLSSSRSASPSQLPKQLQPGNAGQVLPKDQMNRPLRNQQSTPAIRNREDFMSAPANSPLRAMQSATSLAPRRPQDLLAQNKPLSADPGASVPPERRRPSDTSSTRSGTSMSNLVRPESANSARQPIQDDQRSIQTISSVEQPMPTELGQQKSLQARARQQLPPIVPPPARPINSRQDSPQTPSIPPIPPDNDKAGKPVKKKSTGDIAARFRLAATTYTAGGLLGKTKSPTTPSSPFSPDLPKIKVDPGRSFKDKISGPIMEPPPKHDARVSIPVGEPRTPRVPSPSPFERAGLGRLDTKDIAPSSASRPTSPIPPPPASPHPSMDIAETSSRDGRTETVTDRGLKRRSMSPTFRQRKLRALKDSILDEIDTSQLSFNIEDVLKEFNWDWRGRVENLEKSIRKELATVEAKNVLINPSSDERLEELSNLFDQAIEQCEGLDGILTLYAVELTSLTDDIAHIENQSQGLQVQTANQKTLQKELDKLLNTVNISPSQLDILKQGSLESPQGLERIEATLLALYKAMLTIDPSLTNNSSGDTDDENVGSIRALQERKEGYKLESKDFLRRFRQFMNIKFQAELVELQKLIRERDVAGQAGRLGVNAKRPRLMGHDEAYKSLFKFTGLILYAKELDKEEFTELQKLYERPTRAIYQEEVRDHIFAWKRITRKTTHEESELVFTAQEKESERITSTVRTLTVKRSQTIAKSLRSPSSIEFSRDHSKKDPQEGKIYPYEAFSGALEEMFRQVCREQNFVIEFFHLYSQTNVSYEELVQSGTPESRHLGDLGKRRPVDQDRTLGRMVSEYIEEVFSFLLTDIGSFVDWAVKTDSLQGVGILSALEKSVRLLDETNQEFLTKTLNKLHTRLAGLLSKFLDEQVRAIEETKVKIKKRKGVIPFMRIFPQFAARIEDQLPPATLETDFDSTSSTGIRGLVDRGYDKINKAMFESLQAIAKESGFGLPPAIATGGVTIIGGPGAGADPEDKEQLNYHIMMIENMNHYVEDLDTRGNLVLSEYMRRAQVEYKEHMGLYVSAVIRRPLGKLLDFIESIESQLTSSSSLTIEDIASRASHNRSVLKKILSHYDSREVRRGIETLRKRVDKHFAEGDDQDTSKRLLAKMSRELMEEFIRIRERMENIIVGGGAPYQGLELEFSREDAVAGFTK